ncbi:MAG: type transport system ATP-binding protein [Nocardioidaceae bacterium]|nr:type transport system ATP-binding protein [Nocardioidaceae bacterium]
MNGAAVATSGLTKKFGAQVAVDGLDLLVPTGSVYGFLGPNGSGKTTTIRMLLGLVTPTAGTVELLGRAMPQHSGTVLSRVGALVEGPAFHPYLSGRDNLLRLDAADRTTDARTSRRRVDEALERVGLLAAATKRFRAYSLGMRQRLAISGALLRDRDLLVLDEPTNGLDPQGTREVRSLVASLAQEGTTVLISSHLLSEVEQMCSHLGVMHLGRLVAQGTSGEVRAVTEPEATVETDTPEVAARIMQELGLSDIRTGPRSASGRLDGIAPEKVVAACVHAGVAVVGFTSGAPSLEDVFVALTGEGFDVSG